MSLEKFIAGVFVGILIFAILSVGIGAAYFSVNGEDQDDDRSGEESSGMVENEFLL